MESVIVRTRTSWGRRETRRVQLEPRANLVAQAARKRTVAATTSENQELVNTIL